MFMHWRQFEIPPLAYKLIYNMCGISDGCIVRFFCFFLNSSVQCNAGCLLYNDPSQNF